jgi:hypothetical protein
LAKEIRPEAVLVVEPVTGAMREAAKRGPSTGLRALLAHADGPASA